MLVGITYAHWNYPIYDGLDPIWHGYGLDVYKDINHKICYQHPGGVPGYQSRLIYIPSHKMTIVHLSNSQKDNSDFNKEIKTISDTNHCDSIAAKLIFDLEFPHYNKRIQERANMFGFANQIRELIWANMAPTME
jgi:hypothetical protein